MHLHALAGQRHRVSAAVHPPGVHDAEADSLNMHVVTTTSTKGRRLSIRPGFPASYRRSVECSPCVLLVA